MLDNFLLYLSLKEVNLTHVKGIHNQISIKKYHGISEGSTLLAGKRQAGVQPESQIPGHNIDLQMSRVH